jgi:hypothetical protein
VALLACLCAPNGWAQAGSGTSLPSSTRSDAKSDKLPQVDGPQKGSNEWQVWVGGAYPVTPYDGAPAARIWTAGGTYGRVLTGVHGPRRLRGRFEWALEVVPIVEVLLPKYPVYGAGITPIALKWDFVTRRRLWPYLELSGGGLFSNRQVVPGTTTFNFMPSGAAGVSFPWGRSGKYFWTADVRYFHISNAGLTYYNPGLDTIELRVGFGLFSHKK